MFCNFYNWKISRLELFHRLKNSKTKFGYHTFPCERCDFKATEKGNFLRHIKSIHEGVKFSCEQCDYKATQKSHLLRHFKLKHGWNPQVVQFPWKQGDICQIKRHPTYETLSVLMSVTKKESGLVPGQVFTGEG